MWSKECSSIKLNRAPELCGELQRAQKEVIMQLAQIIGIIIGLILLGCGWVLKSFFKRKGWDVASGVIFTIFLYLGVLTVLQNAIFSYASDVRGEGSLEGLLLVWADLFGKYLAHILLAFVGFFYKKDKVFGYQIALLIFIAITLLSNT